MRRRTLALPVLAGWLLAWPAPPGRSQEESDLLLPGQSSERSIAGGEAHPYRVLVSEAPLLLSVDQRGIDLVIEAQGPADRYTSDSGKRRWGLEVLLLQNAGEHRIEVHPREATAGAGPYSIEVEELPSRDGRFAALALMSRAGQEAFADTPEARVQALATYREALAAWRSLGERRWEAESSDAIGMLEAAQRGLRPAVEAYLQALAIWRELHEPLHEAASLNEIGLNRLYMGETEAARESLQSALALWRNLGERFDEGLTRGNLCYPDHIGGSLPAALACYQEVYALFRELGDRMQEARLLNTLGGVHDLQGEPDAALDHYRQALAIYRELGEPRWEAQVLQNTAVVHRVLGDWQEALRLYGQAREILAPLGDRLQEGALLSNLGFAYDSLGESERARTLLEEALKLRQEVGDRRGEVITRNHLGGAWRKLGDLQKALGYHQQALELAVALKDRRSEALTRLRLAEVRLEQRDPAAALRELDPALQVVKEMGLRPYEARALQLRGRALAMAGLASEALPALEDVLARCRDLRERGAEAEALYALASVERAAGLRDKASAHAEEAMAAVEALRTRFVSPDLRAAFLATQRRAYSLAIDLLMDRHAADPKGGYDRKALEVSERARARSLLDVLSAGAVARAGSGAPAELLQRRQSLRRRLSAKADQQLKPNQNGARIEALEREVQILLAELDGVEAEIRRLDPRYAAVAAPPALGLPDIARLLDPGTLLLEYSLGEERSYLWAVDAGKLRSFVLPPRKEIEDLARDLYEELSTVGSDARLQREASELLGKILLADIWGEAPRFRRLIVVPDGALHILPFAALRVPDPGKRSLLESHEVVYLPSATTLALERQRLEQRPPAPKWAAVLADPVFSPADPRVAKPGASAKPATVRSAEARDSAMSFERLLASRREAAEITALAPAGQVWSALDLKASREAVLSGDLRSYRVIHFATHGVADTRNPELSGLVLSLVDAAGQPREGFLGLTDLYDLDLGADLVVLSGCRTALGKEVNGEGLMGLTRGFLYAGAPRVVASLWRVQDRTTAELMTRFYRALWKEHLPPAAALRAAQRSLMSSNPRYKDPYSWAGFVLQGDWR